MRHAVAADAQRAAGAMPTAKPFTRVERRRVPAPPLAVGVACDVSGSMSGFTGPVASTAWILARATASLPAARTATVTYGRQVRPVTYPGAVPARVAEFSAAGKYEDFTRAVSALDGALGLSRPGATRILVIVSDGRYKGTQHADGQKLITRLAASGCLVIWIAPSDTANTMTGARVVILADPAATSRRSPARSPPAPAPPDRPCLPGVPRPERLARTDRSTGIKRGKRKGGERGKSRGTPSRKAGMRSRLPPGKPPARSLRARCHAR